MAVSDGVFDEGTFDNATFNNISRGETVSVNDTASPESDLFRSFNESVDLTANQRKSLFRVLNESFDVRDNYRDAAQLERSLSENVILNDKTSDTKVASGRFQSPSTNTTKSVDVGFEPDVVELKVTSTNPNFNTQASTNGGVKIEGGDFGWSHGYASFGQMIQQVAAGHGSGSASTNGHYSENSDSRCILQPITDASGDNLEGYIQASMQSRDSTGFTLNFTNTFEQQFVTYTAYKFDGSTSYHVGFFDSPTDTSTVNVTDPGFEPNFVRITTTPNLGSIDASVNELGSGTDTVGWSEGVVVENSSEGLVQGSMGVSQWSSNIDGHAYNASDTDCISLAYMSSSKTSLDGTIEAAVSQFTSNGFDVNYKVNNPTTTGGDDYPVVLYMAAEAGSDPTAGFETTPFSTGTQSYSIPFKVQNLNFIGSNTVPDFQSEGGLAGKTWGWMYGEYIEETGFQQAMGWSSNSDSVNGHAYGGSDDDAYYMLFTDNNGTIYGKDVGDVRNMTSNSFDIRWSESTESTDSSYLNFDNTAFIYYGFRKFGGGGLSFQLQTQVSEALGLDDTVVSSSDFFRSLSENVNILDADVRQTEKVLTETVLTSDNVDTEGSFFRSISESLGVSDEVTLSLLKQLQESIALNDELDKRVLLVLSESVSPNDNIERSADLFRQLSEDVTLQDDVRALIIARVVLEESITVSDNVESKAELFREIEDSLTLADEVNSTAELFRNVQETLDLNDEEAARLQKTLTESVGVSDEDVDFLLKTALSETVGLADNVETTAQFFRNLTEFLQLDDADIKELERRLTESLNVVDQFDKSKTQFRDFAETISVQDNTEKAAFKVLTEAVALADEVETRATLFREFTETLQLQDAVAKQLSKVLSENMGVNDSVEDVTEYVRTLNEFLNINDEVVAEITLIARTLQETVAVNDEVSLQNIIKRVLQETLGLNDVLQSKRTAFRQVQETVNLSDSLSKEMTKRLDESITVSDSFFSRNIVGAFASTAEIQKLQKAAANLTATRKAVAELEKDKVSDGDINKF